MSLEDRESRGRSNEGIEGRDRDDAASNRGMAGAPRSCKRQGTESPPELLEGAFPTPPRPALPCHLELGLLASGTVREYIYVVLSHQGDGICYSSQRKLMQALWGGGSRDDYQSQFGPLVFLFFAQ